MKKYHRTFKNIGVVATGTAFAQAVQLGFTPLITRMYGPEAFGLLGTFNAILAVLLPLAGMSYPYAIVLTRRANEVYRLIQLSIGTALVISTCIFVLAYILRNISLPLPEFSDLKPFFYLFPIGVIFFSSQLVLFQYCIRISNFKLFSQVNGLSALLKSSLMVVCGLFFPSGFTLALITVMTYLAASLLIYFRLRSVGSTFSDFEKQRRSSDYKRRLKGIYSIAMKYKDFMFYRTPQTIANVLSQSAPVIIFSLYFGATIAGYFTLARLALAIPANLIGQSVTTVFYPKFSELINKNRPTWPMLLAFTSLLFIITLIPVLSLFNYLPEIFSFVFGQEWFEAGQIAAWMSLWVVLSLAARPAVALIPALRVQGYYLIFELIALLARISLLLISCASDFDFLSIVILFAVLNIFLDLILIIGVLLVSKGHHKLSEGI